MRKRLIGRSVERENADQDPKGLARAAGLAVISAFLTVGCVTPPEGIEVVKGRELDDIPVKSDFEFVESETFAPPLAEGTNFRSWRGLYRGRGLTEEIGPWYVGAMKDQGWTFVGAVKSKGPTYTYDFVKADEQATVRVYREYSTASGGSINMVRAEVHPRGTESFLPDDFETWKTSGVTWTEPRGEVSEEGTQTISFPAETGAEATLEPSGFLLDSEDVEADVQEDVQEELEPEATGIP